MGEIYRNKSRETKYARSANLFLPTGAHLNCEIKTFDFLDIRHLRYFKGTHTVRLPCKYYIISQPSKYASKKFTFY